LRRNARAAPRPIYNATYLFSKGSRRHWASAGA
jgi:hypothetical protein